VDWLATKEIEKPTKHTFTNAKGMKVDYWVMKPANFVAGQKYPLVLDQLEILCQAALSSQN
jgi:dipeptidyl aminopeptidase/acylaminoacyl peptidase